MIHDTHRWLFGVRLEKFWEFVYSMGTFIVLCRDLYPFSPSMHICFFKSEPGYVTDFKCYKREIYVFFEISISDMQNHVQH